MTSSRSSPTGTAYSAKSAQCARPPALFQWLIKKGIWKRDRQRRGMLVNLDIGGGPFEVGTRLARRNGVENLVHDKGNRTTEHNQAVVARLRGESVDTVTISNVLNVIPERDVRLAVLEFARKYAARDGAPVFIKVWEGKALQQRAAARMPGHAIYDEARDTWQLFHALEWYLPDVRSVFPDARIAGGRVIVCNTGEEP